MKIAFIVNTFTPRMGGLEQHLQNLTQGLSQLGVDVTVFTIGDEVGTRMDGSVRVLTGKRYFPIADIVSFPRFGTCRRLARALKEGEFDAVSIHTRFFPMTFIGLRAAQKAGLPVIVTEHGGGHVASRSALVRAGSWLVDQTFGRFVLSRSDRVLAVSDDSVSFARSLGAERPTVFLNAIEQDSIMFDSTDRPSNLVFVGRVVPGKGWDLFINAISKLRSVGLEVRGELLGDGYQLEDARRLVSDLGLQEVIKVRGRVDSSSVRNFLSGSTLVNASVLAEGFQITIVEAVAAGGRVVSFDGPGARMLRSQGAPVVITKERTLQSLVESLELYLKNPPPIVDESFLKSWTWSQRSKEYFAILAEVVSSEGATGSSFR